MKNLLLVVVFAMVYNSSIAVNVVIEMPFQQEPKKEKKMVFTDENGMKTEMKSSDIIFINENGDTTKPKYKDVRIEKEIEDGKEKIRIWVNGEEMKENSEEFKKYANEEHREGNGKGEEAVKMMNLEEGKKVIIRKEEREEEIIIDGESVEVTELQNGKRMVTIRKKGVNGKEEVEEFIIDERGESEEIIKTSDREKVVVKVEKEVDFDLGEINPDDIEKVNVIKTDKENKIVITLKDGKVIEKIVANEGEKQRGKVEKEVDFDLGEINPDDIEKVNVIKTDKENKIVITLKDGKVIEKIVAKDGEKEVIIIKEEKKKKKD
jgi:hypothetical protein